MGPAGSSTSVHWPLPAEALRPLLPAGLTLDTYDGQAWLGIIPFLMDSVRFRWLPGIPSTTRFAEINVRTYVTADDKPGIFFLSLDANSLLAIIGARASYALPYYRARFAITTREDAIDYRCERVGKTPADATSPATFAAHYQRGLGVECALNLAFHTVSADSLAHHQLNLHDPARELLEFLVFRLCAAA